MCQTKYGVGVLCGRDWRAYGDGSVRQKSEPGGKDEKYVQVPWKLGLTWRRDLGKLTEITQPGISFGPLGVEVTRVKLSMAANARRAKLYEFDMVVPFTCPIHPTNSASPNIVPPSSLHFHPSIHPSIFLLESPVNQNRILHLIMPSFMKPNVLPT